MRHFQRLHIGQRLLLVLVLASAVAFGAIVKSALAQRHWHHHNGIWHGLVHGSDTRDSYFFSRVDSPWLNYNYCLVGDTDRGWYHSTAVSTYGTNVCQDWSHDYGVPGWINECRGAAWVDQGGTKLDPHHHLAHNYYATPCPAFWA